ncbi:MAG: hypothetical protein LUE88_00940 [Clostridiales bacterium]|nr:hypothetical protein [Clostridiales bacterium]
MSKARQANRGKPNDVVGTKFDRCLRQMKGEGLSVRNEQCKWKRSNATISNRGRPNDIVRT